MASKISITGNAHRKLFFLKRATTIIAKPDPKIINEWDTYLFTK